MAKEQTTIHRTTAIKSPLYPSANQLEVYPSILLLSHQVIFTMKSIYNIFFFAAQIRLLAYWKVKILHESNIIENNLVPVFLREPLLIPVELLQTHEIACSDSHRAQE